MPTTAPVHRNVKAHFAMRQPVLSTPEDTRDSPSRRGYDGRWQQLRLWYLVRHPICEREGCGRPASQVHHRNPFQAGGERLNQDNLQALCASCHSRETRRHAMQRRAEEAADGR